MVLIVGETVVARPVEEVFDHVADQTNEPRYNPRMSRSERVTGGAIGVGTRFKASIGRGARGLEMAIEVTGYDRPRWFATRSVMSWAVVDGGLTFEPVEGGTRMRWSWDVRPKGLGRLLTPLVGLVGRRQEAATWSGLKAQLEGQRR